MLKKPDKISIRHKEVHYEGIPAASAIGMALLESTGVRRLIDQRCRFDPDRRIMSPGMVVKALIGPTFNIRNKYPMYLVNKAYTSAPTDRLFGPNVCNDDLYDTALGRGLDTLFGTDLDVLFMDCADLCTGVFGFESHVYHMDSTDISFWGKEKEPEEDVAVPRRNGHPKDGRNDLLQYEMQVLTDSNRIIRYMKPYSGATTDPIMDYQTLEFIGTHFTEDERKLMTIVGDCKLVTERNVRKMIELGLGFVSKVPEDFGYHAIERAKDEALRSGMKRYGSEDGSRKKDGLWIADVDSYALFGPKKDRRLDLRFIVFNREDEVHRRLESIRSASDGEVRRRYSHLTKTRFRTEFEAWEAFKKVRVDPDSPFRVEARAVRMRKEIGLVGGDSHKKNYNPPKRYDEWWSMELDPVFSEEKAWRIAIRDSLRLLVTNLPRKASSDRTSYRDGVMGEGVLELYNQEYKVEQSFRLMKSGIGMNSIYFQTPSRENAMMFVVSVAVLLSNIADAMFRRADMRLDGRPMTMYSLAHELQTTMVTFSRSDNALELMGPSGAADRFFDVTDALRINPQLLLGYTED